MQKVASDATVSAGSEKYKKSEQDLTGDIIELLSFQS